MKIIKMTQYHNQILNMGMKVAMRVIKNLIQMMKLMKKQVIRLTMMTVKKTEVNNLILISMNIMINL